MKIDADKQGGKAGIHWHIGKENQIRHTSIDDNSEEIVRVELRSREQVRKTFINSALARGLGETGQVERIMDCVDCHNRATHIYEDPNRALDRHIAEEPAVPRLPLIKREALRAITGRHSNKKGGMEAVEDRLEAFGRRFYPELAESETATIRQAVCLLQSLYHRNTHPQMNIEWGTYPDHIGHESNGGCFRCYNLNMKSADGEHIAADCTTCHSILAFKEPDPLMYLDPIQPATRDSKLQLYLRKEFLEYYCK